MNTIIDVYEDSRNQFSRPNTEEISGLTGRLDDFLGSQGLKDFNNGWMRGSGFILKGVYMSPDCSVIVTDNNALIGKKVIDSSHVAVISNSDELAESVAQGIRGIYLQAGYSHELSQEFSD